MGLFRSAAKILGWTVAGFVAFSVLLAIAVGLLSDPKESNPSVGNHSQSESEAEDPVSGDSEGTAPRNLEVVPSRWNESMATNATGDCYVNSNHVKVVDSIVSTWTTDYPKFTAWFAGIVQNQDNETRGFTSVSVSIFNVEGDKIGQGSYSRGSDLSGPDAAPPFLVPLERGAFLIDVSVSMTEYAFFGHLEWCVSEGRWTNEDIQEWEKQQLTATGVVRALDYEEAGEVDISVRNHGMLDTCGYVHVIAWLDNGEVAGFNSAFVFVGANTTRTVNVPFLHLRGGIEASMVSVIVWESQ